MNHLHGWVTEFHETFEIPNDDHTRAGRWPIVREEIVELKAALDSGERAAIAQECADVVYVVYGTAIAFDIHLDQAVREVHRANMSKLGLSGKPLKDQATGKVLKGPKYKPPDMRLALAKYPEGTVTWE